MSPLWMLAAKRAALLALVPAAGMAGLTLFMAWQHNPQNAYFGAEWSSFTAWLRIGMSWFLLTLILAFALLMPLSYFYLAMRRRRSNVAVTRSDRPPPISATSPRA